MSLNITDTMKAAAAGTVASEQLDDCMWRSGVEG